MALKTSLLITGDSSVAQKAVGDLAHSVDVLATSSKATAQALTTADASEKAAAASAKAMATAQAEAGAAMRALAAASANAGGSLGAFAGDMARANGAALASSQALKAHTQATNDNAAAANRQAFGLRNLGQQFGDLGLSITGGIDPARAFGQQAGQMGYALSEMGGKAGAVGAFLTGPWGIALTIGAAVLAPFVEKLLVGGNAADEQAKALADAASAADSYGTAQSTLGKIVDLTTGKLKTQNVTLIETIKLQARANILAAQAAVAEGLGGDAAPSLAKIGKVGDRPTATFGETLSDFGKAAGSANPALTLIDAALSRGRKLGALTSDLKSYTDAANRYQAVLANPKSSASDISVSASAFNKTLTVTLDNVGKSAKIAGRDSIDAQQKILAVSKALADQKANIEALAVANGGPVPDDLKPYARNPKPKQPKKPKQPLDYSALISSTKNDIESLTAAFTDAPTYVEKARAAVAKLQGDIDQLAKKKPLGFETLIASAREAQGVIQANISKPYDDYIKSQQQALVYQQLILSGHADQAAALRAINALEEKQPPLDAAHRNEVLATNQALDFQARQLDILHEKNQKYLTALGGIRGVVDDATQAFVRGDLGQLLKSPGKLLDAFQTLQGQAVFDKLFNGVFRDLQDQVNGVSPVQDAATRMATSVDHVSNASGRTADAFGKLATAAIQAKGAFDGSAGTHTLGGEKLSDELHAMLSQGNGIDKDIVVNGTRNAPDVRIFDQSLGKVATSIAGIFTNPENAKTIGTNVGKYAGKGLEGAATGTLVNGIIAPIGKALGIKTSQTGAQIGGAIGSFIPIPGGQIIGSIVGSVLGGLLGAKKSNGSATVEVGKTGTFEATAGTGASAEYAKQANTLATSLAGGLQQIADALGGTAKGASGISIGVNNGNFHVNSVGGAIGQKGSGDVNFGQDQAGAVAYALQQEVAKGAISGLSGAVAKALQSSTDIDAALKEALKVSDVETMLGGVVGQYQKAFKDFEITARDRVRIAQQYGFDVLAIEKRNADDRKKLADQLAKAQAGSLQSLIDEITRGSLFEGSALDKITALNTAIAKAKTDLDNNVEGAGDQLAALYQQRLQASKDAYGTTSGYAADRNATISEAQAAVARINAQITAAQASQKASDPALATTNAALDENNDQNSQMIVTMREGFASLSAQLALRNNDLSSLKLLAKV